MYSQCRHILPSGCKCRAAALRDKAYCYFHMNMRQFGENRGSRDKKEPLLLPSIEDSRGIQIALTQVLGGLASSRIDPRNARIYIAGLQLAARLASLPEPTDPPKQVSDICYENDGDVFAPKVSVCEPPDDCIPCDKRKSCRKFPLHALLHQDKLGHLEIEPDAEESQMED